MEIINEHEMGITEGTDLEKEVQANFQGECAEVGMYLAMARQAQRDGLPEVAEVLKRIAYEESRPRIPLRRDEQTSSNQPSRKTLK